jgi:hypothetical protein
MPVPRWITVITFAIVAVVVFLIYSSGAASTADDIRREAILNETGAESAPQQQVVAAWATRDALIEEVRQNGVRNGLLGVCAAMLVSIAVSMALVERRARNSMEEHPSVQSVPLPDGGHSQQESSRPD